MVSREGEPRPKVSSIVVSMAEDVCTCVVYPSKDFVSKWRQRRTPVGCE